MPKPKLPKEKIVSEKESLKDSLNDFKDKMLDELMDKLSKGYVGWDDVFNANYMKEQISNHLAKGDFVAVANLAMFLETMETEE
jgi:hypothetical protein